MQADNASFAVAEAYHAAPAAGFIRVNQEQVKATSHHSLWKPLSKSEVPCNA